jgi:SAM-dependent methyltransferase
VAHNAGVAREGCDTRPSGAPSPWLLAHASLLPVAGRALDVACGRGRHALWLAARGLQVRAIDRDRESLDALSREAQSLGLVVAADVVDLEAGPPGLGSGYRLIVVVNYLHRPLFPALRSALAPGGLLVYETFLETQGERRRPSRPEHLLRPGELLLLVSPLDVVDMREGESRGRRVASIVARASS